MDISSLMTRKECLEMMFQIWNPVRKTEIISIDDAYGRVLAENLYSKYDFPVFRASMMDGIAVRSSDFRSGMPDTSSWSPGVDYVRADTGDDFDDAFDAVIQIELVEMLPEGGILLHLPEGTEITSGRSIRNQGSQLGSGELIALAGRRLNAVSLTAAASGGYSEIPVYRQPRTGYIPTGSELVTPDRIPKRGQNIASNAYHIRHLITMFGGIPTCYPVVPDDPEQLREAFSRALSENDIVLMSGGSSKGEEDYTSQILKEFGTEIFSGVRCVPGRPMSAFVGDNKPLINLSGPPAASLHGMFWLVRPLIARFLGTSPYELPQIHAILGEDMDFPGVMEAFKFFTLVKSDDGRYFAFPQGAQGPARFSKPAPSVSDGQLYQENNSQTVTFEEVPGGIRDLIHPDIRNSGYGLLADAFYISSLGESHRRKGEILKLSLLINPSEI